MRWFVWSSHPGGGIISEWRATSFRNDGRLRPESAEVGPIINFQRVIRSGRRRTGRARQADDLASDRVRRAVSKFELNGNSRPAFPWYGRRAPAIRNLIARTRRSTFDFSPSLSFFPAAIGRVSALSCRPNDAFHDRRSNVATYKHLDFVSDLRTDEGLCNRRFIIDDSL